MTDTDLRQSETNPREAQLEFRSVSPKGVVLGLIVAGAGGLVLVGWGLDVPWLKSVLPGFVTMKANTAAGFILTGMALGGFAARAVRLRPLALASAGAVALLGLLTLGEYLLHLNLGIDQLLFVEPPGAWGTLAPGRMAPATALDFLLLGTALLLVERRRTLPIAQGLILLTGLIGLVSLMGYLYGASALYGVGHYAQMAILTAVLFVFSSLGAHWLHPADGMMRTLTPDTMGGWLLRRMMPFVIGVPLALGWLRVQGERNGWYEGPLGVALMMATMMFLLTLLVWWTALTLTQMEAVRHKAEAELHGAMARLRESEETYRNQFTGNSSVMLLVDAESGAILDANAAARRFYGYPQERLRGMNIHDINTLPAGELRQIMASIAQEQGKRFQFKHRLADGSLREVESSISRIQSGGRNILHSIVHDITVRKKAEEALISSISLLNATLESTADGILVVDRQGHIRRWNQKFADMWQVPQEILSDNREEPLLNHVLKQMAQPEAFLAKVMDLYEHPEESSVDQLNLADGRIFQRYTQPQRVGSEIVGRVWCCRDITERMTLEEELRAAALTDKLTGLPNRTLFCDRLQQAVRRAQRLKDYHFAVLFLDLDRFKIINDSLGHAVGDQMLQEISRRLHAAVRAGDSLSRSASPHTTARLGGDEFVILLDGLRRPADATVVAGRLLEVLSQQYRLGDHELYTTASIGIVTSDVAADNADQMLRDADTAMYEAKLAGKGQYVVFSAPMRQRMQKRLHLENDLRKALDAGQLFLVYEPIVSLQTGQLRRFEVLVRWQHPERGVIMPGEFIAIAEETGLILPIGEWVLREACAQFGRWRQSLGDAAPPSISVNLSRNQLMLRRLPETIRGILAETGMPAEHLHLEVTESAVMTDAAAAIRTLHAIKAIGVKLDMDDFGTGYSSLACLHQFPIDVLKIDRSFVVNIERGRDYAALIHAVSQLARNLNIQVVAEGVETVDQALILQSLECEYGQGYLFGKAMPAAEVARFKVHTNVWDTISDLAESIAMSLG